MYAIMGVTGRVGSLIADQLLKNGHPVRAILRDASKAENWRKRGAQIALADIEDPKALTEAFMGVKGVFVMQPPNFAPLPGFVEAHKRMGIVKGALLAAHVQKFVCLSSIGAEQDHGIGLIEHSHLMEKILGSVPVPSAFLRAGWFMDNCEWDVTPAKNGKLLSYLQPLDHPISMAATEDIAQAAVQILTESWTGQRYIEVAGPQKVSPLDIARGFSEVLGEKVDVIPVPREQWQANFVAQGMPADRTAPRAEMVDAFNSEWIHFDNPNTEKWTGKTHLITVIERLVARSER